MLVHGTTALVRFTPGTAADIEASAEWIDYDPDGTPSTDRFTPGQDVYPSNTGTTATTIIPSPAAADIRRNVRHITIRNNHATQASVITVEITDGTDTVELLAPNLLANETLEYHEGTGWIHFDSNHGPYPAIGNIASQAEMEAGTSTEVVVTPGRQHFHPSASKFWVQTTGGATQVIGVSYNVTSIGDTAVGRMTVTIATDFSSANWVVSVTTGTATATGDEGIPNWDTKAAGSIVCTNRIVTPAFADPNIGYDVAGYGDQ